MSRWRADDLPEAAQASKQSEASFDPLRIELSKRQLRRARRRWLLRRRRRKLLLDLVAFERELAESSATVCAVEAAHRIETAKRRLEQNARRLFR